MKQGPVSLSDDFETDFCGNMTRGRFPRRKKDLSDHRSAYLRANFRNYEVQKFRQWLQTLKLEFESYLNQSKTNLKISNIVPCFQGQTNRIKGILERSFLHFNVSMPQLSFGTPEYYQMRKIFFQVSLRFSYWILTQGFKLSLLGNVNPNHRRRYDH